ncbi:MAG: ABC transporter substrate-binding protein, partial [Raoultibacter sp.]
LRSLINSRGEEAALAYFDGLAENIYQFSSSGSGPVNALVQGEALIGLGMTYQAVSEINQGVPIEIVFFAEGSPWTMNGVAIVDGKQEKPAVRAVMDWMFSTGIMLDKQEFVPDKVFVDQHTEIPNFPQNMEYADMSGIFDIDEKQRLLKKWKY